MVLAAVVLLAITGLRRSREPARVTSGQRVILAFAGAALAVHFGAWIASLDYTSVAVSTLLVSTTPLWTAAYDALVHRRMLAAPSAVAFASGAVGLAMVVGFDRTAAPQPGHEWFGSALALLGALGIAAYLLLARAVRSALHTRAIVTHTYTWAALFLVLAAAAARQGPPRLTDTVAWGGILAMAVVSQLLGHTALNAALRWFTPSAVAFASLLEPVFAALFAWFWIGERMGSWGWIGAGCIWAGILAVETIKTEK